MPNISFYWYRDAGDENRIFGPWGTAGPNSGSTTVNLPYGQTYSLTSSGSGPGYTEMQVFSDTRIGLDDRRGAGADNDFNDMILDASAGRFSSSGGTVYYSTPTPVFGCTDPEATNYNPNAQTNDGSCIYPIPVPSLTFYGQETGTMIRGDITNIQWEISNYDKVTSAFINPGNYQVTYNGGNLSLSPTQTTTYTLCVNYLVGGGGQNCDSVTIVVYVPPNITLTVDNNPIVRGQTTTLRWSVTGDGSVMNVQPTPGITNLNSNVSISPTVTTTYVATVTGPGGSDTEELTVTVWQPPTLTITSPEKIAYGSNTSRFYYDFTNTTSISGIIRYFDLDGQLVASDNVVLPLQTDSYALNNIPWGDRGPYQISGVFVATGQGNQTVTKNFYITVDIDQTPDYIDIPESDNTFKDQEPVVTPDATVVSEQIEIIDVDIPVEIKADKPIQVQIDDNGIWNDIREI